MYSCTFSNKLTEIMVIGEIFAFENATFTNNDSTSVVYVLSSDCPRMMLVSSQFDGAGYRSWRRGVMRVR